MKEKYKCKNKYFFLVAVLFLFGNHVKAQLKLKVGAVVRYEFSFLDTSSFDLAKLEEKFKFEFQKNGGNLSKFQYGPSFEVGIPLLSVYFRSSLLFSEKNELKIPLELYYSRTIAPFFFLKEGGGVSFFSGINTNLMFGKEKNILDQIQRAKSFKPELKMGIKVDIFNHLQIEVSSEMLAPIFRQKLFSFARHPFTNFTEEIATLTYFF